MNSYCCLLRFKNLISNPVNIRCMKTSAKLPSRSSCFIKQSAQVSWYQPTYKIQLIRPSIMVRSYAVTATNEELPHYKKEKHAKTWVAERIVSMGLLAVFPLMFSIYYQDLECVASLLTALHIQWGLEATLKDYLRPSIVGNVIPKYVTLYAGSISMLLLAFLLWISIHGNGISKSLKQLWYLDLTIE